MSIVLITTERDNWNVKSEWIVGAVSIVLITTERERENRNFGYTHGAWIGKFVLTTLQYTCIGERSTLTTEDNGKVSRNGEWSWGG